MKFHTEISRGAAVVQPRGREMVMGDADVGMSNVLNELAAAGVRRVFLDLSRVRDIDGACLQEILAWGRRFKKLGGELALMSPGLNNVSSLVTLLEEIRSYPDRSEALEASGVRVSRMKIVTDGARRMLDDVLGKKVPLRVPA